METIKFENFFFEYKNSEKAVLENIDLEINKGDFVLIAGESGSGKSTLLKQFKPSLVTGNKYSGKILIDGREDYEKLDALCGLVMQSPSDQFVSEYVWHEISFGLESLGADADTIRKKVAETTSFFGLEKIFGKKVSELSDGQKETVALASIVAMDPEVLVLDEPTSRLDPFAEHSFMSVISRLHKEFGMTIVVTSHFLDGYISLCNRLVIINNGKISADDTPEKVIEFLYKSKNKMFLAMPAQSVISSSLGMDDIALDVNEGKILLEEFAKNSPPVNLTFSDKTPGGKTIIAVKDLSFSYGENDILRDLNLSVSRGEIYSIFGGNGSGKTTLLNVLFGIEKNFGGKIDINSENVLFYVPQDPRILFSQNTVIDELKLSSENIEKINDVLESCRLKNLITRHPYDLSGGEQQRLAIAKMLLKNADIILLDEPTKGIDYINKIKLKDILLNLKNQGKTVIIVSHDVEFCAYVADRSALLFDGRIISENNTRKFISGNSFYTTNASKVSKNILKDAITTDEVLEAFNCPIFGFSDFQNTNHKESKNPVFRDLTLENEALPNIKTGFLFSILAAFLIGLTVFLEYNFIDNKKYFIMTVSLMIEITAVFFLMFERSRPKTGEIVVIAIMSAIAVAGRAAFFAVANFKPVIAIVIITGFTLGKRAGFITGALSMLLSNFIFGQGTWTIFQMFAAGMIGFLSGFFDEEKCSKLGLCIFGAISTVLIYGGIVNPSFILTYQNEITLQMIAATYLTGLPLDIIHASATFLFLWIGFHPMVEKIRRAKLKYDIS